MEEVEGRAWDSRGLLEAATIVSGGGPVPGPVPGPVQVVSVQLVVQLVVAIHVVSTIIDI